LHLLQTAYKVVSIELVNELQATSMVVSIGMLIQLHAT
jgi:hypothetical protein